MSDKHHWNRLSRSCCVNADKQLFCHSLCVCICVGEAFNEASFLLIYIYWIHGLNFIVISCPVDFMFFVGLDYLLNYSNLVTIHKHCRYLYENFYVRALLS